MDSHLSITGLHRESARTPVGSAEEEGLRRKLVFDKSSTDGPDSSKMAGVCAVMLFDRACRYWQTRRIDHESFFDHRPSVSRMAPLSVDVAADGCRPGGGGDTG